jgi:hypothetical protein
MLYFSTHSSIESKTISTPHLSATNTLAIHSSTALLFNHMALAAHTTTIPSNNYPVNLTTPCTNDRSLAPPAATGQSTLQQTQRLKLTQQPHIQQPSSRNLITESRPWQGPPQPPRAQQPPTQQTPLPQTRMVAYRSVGKAAYLGITQPTTALEGAH